MAKKSTKNLKSIQPALSSQQLRELKSQLHHLKPVVIVGNNGLTANVLQEIERALDDHELIKIRFSFEEQEQQSSVDIAKMICTETNSTLVQTIGHIIAIYRANPISEEA